MKSKLLRPFGVKTLRQHIENQLPTLRQSPILLITSEPLSSTKSTTNVRLAPVSEASRWVQFTLAQQFGLGILESKIISAYPSVQDLDSKLELMRRIGATSIVGVGSGGAMDLAKALAQHKGDSMQELILIPSTPAAVLASGASHSLLLDSAEETIIPFPEKDTFYNGATTVVPLDKKYMVQGDSHQLLCAILAVALDASLRKKSHHELLEELCKKLNGAFTEQPARLAREMTIDLLYQAGQSLSYGLGKEDRSPLLALASSLIPQTYPHVHILDFWASLLPGLWKVASQESVSNETATLVESLLANRSVSDMQLLTAVDHNVRADASFVNVAKDLVHANQAACKSYDIPDSTLKDILFYSIKHQIGAEVKLSDS